MKVLALIDSLSYGGAEKLLATLAGTREAGVFDLAVLSVAPRSSGRTQMLDTLLEAGLEVGFADISRLADPTAVPRLARLLRASGADVVHAHLGYAAILGPVAARLAGLPSVATLHHVPGPISRPESVKERLMVEVPARLGRLVLVSDAARAAFAARYPQRSSWRVIHNGIDLDRFRVAPARLPVELGVPEGAPVVAFVSALREPKGHLDALHAWPRVLRSHPDARLLVVGDGPYRASIESESARLGLSERVLLTGARDDIDRLMQASDLVVLPSHTEALPTALAEAAASGRAVVASRVGGVPETVVHGETGLLVPPHDPRSFGEAVAALLADPATRQRFGARGRALAEERFDRIRWRDRLLDLYREVGA